MRAVEMRADVTVAQSGAQIFMSCGPRSARALMSTGGAAIKATSRSSTGEGRCGQLTRHAAA